MLQLPRPARPRVSVVLPARDEAATVGGIVAALAGLDPPPDEVVVVDDGSADDTAAVAAAAGARVVATAGPGRGRRGPGWGKGRALWTGLAATGGDVVVFCDADLAPFDPGYVTALVDALVSRPGAVLVKGAYHRTGTGGRVTELAAKPVVDLLHPHLSHLDQPLGGEYAGWRWALEQVPFVAGWGVDLGLVLDVAARFGAGAVAEAALGPRSHRNRPLAELRPQARAVLEVALHRAGCRSEAPAQCPPLAGRPAADPGAA